MTREDSPDVAPRIGRFIPYSMPSLVLCAGALLGIVLRLRLYLENRSLWLDPAMLALNIIDRSWFELLGRLDMNQAAPPGFLLFSKWFGSVFDYSERALTFLPLVAGTAAFLLFIRLSIEVLGSVRAPLAYLPMATCSTAIFYCSEFRPHSLDLLGTVVLLLVGRRALERDFSSRTIWIFTAISIVGVWFSFASVFVAVGVGAVLLATALFSGRRRGAFRLSVALAVAGTHLLLFYLFQIQPAVGSDLIVANREAFAPVAAMGREQWWWWVLAVTGFFEFPLGFWGLYFVALVGAAIGFGRLASRRATAPFAAMLAAPILAAAFASTLGLYPISTGIHEVKSRFVLFLVPVVLLFAATGISRILDFFGRRKVPALGLIALFLLPTLYGGFVGPRFRGQEIRPLLEYLRQELREGDAVYVFRSSIPAFRYSTRNEPIAAVYGAWRGGTGEDLVHDLGRIGEADRLWVVMSHTYRGERRSFRRALKAIGHIEGTRRTSGAALVLCRLETRSGGDPTQQVVNGSASSPGR